MTPPSARASVQRRRASVVEHFDGRWAAVELASIFGLRDDVIVE